MMGPRGGLLFRGNGDVYFVADGQKDLKLMGLKNVTNYVSKVPYKMNTLCGKDITGENKMIYTRLFRIRLIHG